MYSLRQMDLIDNFERPNLLDCGEITFNEDELKKGKEKCMKHIVL